MCVLITKLRIINHKGNYFFMVISYWSKMTLKLKKIGINGWRLSVKYDSGENVSI